MPDKEYATKFIYRCSSCGAKVEVKAEDSFPGFQPTTLRLSLEQEKRRYIRAMLTGVQNNIDRCKIHECGGDNTVTWGRLELVGVMILDKVGRE